MRFRPAVYPLSVVSLLLWACGEQSPSAEIDLFQETPELHKRKTRIIAVDDLPSANFLDVRHPENLLVMVVTKSSLYVDPPEWMMQNIRRYKRHSTVAAPPFSIALKNGRFDESDLRGGMEGLHISPLYDALKKVTFKAPSARTGGVLLYAEKDVEWGQIQKIVYTLFQARFTEVGLIARSGNKKFVIPLSRRAQHGVGGEWNAWWHVLSDKVIQSHQELVVWPKISISQEGIFARLYEGGPPVESDDAAPSIFRIQSIESPRASKARFVLPTHTYAYEEIAGAVKVHQSTKFCRTESCTVATVHQGEIQTGKGEKLLIHSDSPNRCKELRALISQIQQVAPRVLPPLIEIDQDIPLSNVAPDLATLFRQTGQGRINSY